jgi:hypothetical protein
MTRLFPYAIHVVNDAAGIAAGLRMAADRHAALVGTAARARALQEERWNRQLELLRRRLELDGTRPASTILRESVGADRPVPAGRGQG